MGTFEQYEAELAAWRAEMEASLRAPDGWLALAGLFWLEEGENSVGAGEDCAVALPAGRAPALAGALVRAGERVTLRPAPGAGLLVNGEPASERELAADMPGPADTVTLGSLTFFVIRRGERIGVRLRDSASPARESFEGRRWYPARAEYRVAAEFVPHDAPRTIAVPNILGDVDHNPSPGFVRFQLGGQELTLHATASGKKLFFIFRDATSGHGTYGVGRFLYTDGPEGGVVDLDFNRAYNPPCAFTDYATCPMPPRENHLPVAVEAGEQFEGHH